MRLVGWGGEEGRKEPKGIKVKTKSKLEARLGEPTLSGLQGSDAVQSELRGIVLPLLQFYRGVSLMH